MKPHEQRFKEAVGFGKQLIITQDLDPVYPAAVELRDTISWSKFCQWLFAYWCFYHAATACWIAQGHREEFWVRLFEAATDKRFPRSSERRHFRGRSSLNTVKWFAENLSPHQLLKKLLKCTTFEDVQNVTKELPLFGPWITFKVADMLERLELADIQFNEATLNMYRDPQLGAALVMTGELTEPQPEHLHAAVENLSRALGHLQAPPHPSTRVVGLQEVETVLCKFKSFYKGRYWVGKDILEIREGFEIFPIKSGECNTPLSEIFLNALPPEIAR